LWFARRVVSWWIGSNDRFRSTWSRVCVSAATGVTARARRRHRNELILASDSATVFLSKTSEPYDERILPDKQIAAIERSAGMIASLIAYIKPSDGGIKPAKELIQHALAQHPSNAEANYIMGRGLCSQNTNVLKPSHA
jgi:hypothetical protein